MPGCRMPGDAISFSRFKNCPEKNVRRCFSVHWTTRPETVALAAAKALTARGERARVDGYLERHPGARSDRLSNDLSLLS